MQTFKIVKVLVDAEAIDPLQLAAACVTKGDGLKLQAIYCTIWVTATLFFAHGGAALG